MHTNDPKALQLMNERFGHDTLLALATLDGGLPAVRTVNAYYEDGCFYSITYALSGKMKQLAANPAAAVCGEWFTGRGVGETLGWLCDEANKALLEKLRTVFASWYENGHINEADPNTVILRVRLTEGVLMSHGTRYTLSF